MLQFMGSKELDMECMSTELNLNDSTDLKVCWVGRFHMKYSFNAVKWTVFFRICLVAKEDHKATDYSHMEENFVT